MAISLSEQLESDIKEYLHKTFGMCLSNENVSKRAPKK